MYTKTKRSHVKSVRTYICDKHTKAKKRKEWQGNSKSTQYERKVEVAIAHLKGEGLGKSKTKRGE